ncbi:hypothetical protein ACHQM5_000218 [Ranunculus cassubicifolius]
MHQNHKPHSHTNFASCIVATIFLLFIAIVVLILFFSLFKPKDPRISVNAVQLPTFSISNSTVTFTFSQYNSVKNPNRATFNHFDSTLQLLYSGNQVGFMFIPAGTIDAGRTKYMSATFSVQSFPLMAETAIDSVNGVSVGGGGSLLPAPLGPTLEIESKMKMVGRVRVLHFFTHHVETRIGCNVLISVGSGSVVGLKC